MTAARIGPNAVTQLAAAFDDLRPEMKQEIFARAGATNWLAEPPQTMVDERAVAKLHLRVRADMPEPEADRLLMRAGERTADYILANRIPAPLRLILPLLPARVSAAILSRAIARHAWTFAGSGQFRLRKGAGLVIEIGDNPLCRGLVRDHPSCSWHTAVFSRLFAALVHPEARAHEFSCCAEGDAACRFVMDWPRTGTLGQIKASHPRPLPFSDHDPIRG